MDGPEDDWLGTDEPEDVEPVTVDEDTGPVEAGCEDWPEGEPEVGTVAGVEEAPLLEGPEGAWLEDGEPEVGTVAGPEEAPLLEGPEGTWLEDGEPDVGEPDAVAEETGTVEGADDETPDEAETELVGSVAGAEEAPLVEGSSEEDWLDTGYPEVVAGTEDAELLDTGAESLLLGITDEAPVLETPLELGPSEVETADDGTELGPVTAPTEVVELSSFELELSVRVTVRVMTSVELITDVCVE